MAFDGFDEIRDANVNRTNDFLRRLNELDNVRLLISSRPHMRSHLEQTFGVIAYDILPFTLEDQIKAMVGHWLNKWPAGDPHTLEEFAFECVESINELQSLEIGEIFGVPLKCYILAVVNETSAGQVSSINRRNRPFKIDVTATVESISQLYEQFVYASFGKLESCGVCSDLQHKMSTFHTLKAFEDLFPDVSLAYKSMFNPDSSMLPWVPKAGIMVNKGQDELEFVHRSFAEFFVGKFFAEFWMNVEQLEERFLGNMGVYFLENILQMQTPKNDMSVWLDKVKYLARLSLLPNQSKTIPGFSSSHTVLWFMNSFYRCQVDKIKQEKCVEQFKLALSGNRPVEPKWMKVLTHFPLMTDRSTVNAFKHNFGKRIYDLLSSCIYKRFNALLSLLVQIVKCFYSKEEIPDLVFCTSVLRKNHQRNVRISLLLSRIASKASPESAREVFRLFENSCDNFLLNFCLTFPAKYPSPLDVAIDKNDLDMAVYFADKFNLPWEQLFVKCLMGDEMPKESVNARVTIMNQLLGSVDRISDFFNHEKIVEYLNSISLSVDNINISILFCLAAEKCLKFNSASLDDKVVFLERGLFKKDIDLIKLLILLFGKLPEQIEPDSIETLNLGHIKTEMVLQSINRDDAHETFQRLNLQHDIGAFRHLHNIETQELMVALYPDFSRCNESRWNYLHYACKQGKVDWVEFLIVNGHDVNQQDRQGNTPLLLIAKRRATQLIQVLVNNGASIYAVNQRNENCLHCLLKTCTVKDSELVREWFDYTWEMDCLELWKMEDNLQRTPLDLVSDILQSGHPSFVRFFDETWYNTQQGGHIAN